MGTNGGLTPSDVPRTEVDLACATVRRYGYDCANFRYSMFRPVHRAADAALSGDFVVVSMVWPTIRSEMYRSSNGGWVRDFERDLVSMVYDRRSTARAGDSGVTLRARV